MRLVVARCSVNYAGRLESTLPEATRLIMVKADGCVAIHADGVHLDAEAHRTLGLALVPVVLAALLSE